MLTCSLQSGSNGNCIYVEAGGVRLLFDAGISGRQAALRLGRHERDLHGVSGLILSHCHSDHTSAAGVLQRRYHFPIFATPGTVRGFAPYAGRLADVRAFEPGETLEFGPVRVHTVPTPHDAAQAVAFIVEHAGRRLGIFTDLGHPFAGLERALEIVDAAYLESNYDPQMLREGWYPPELKARIAGARGHLSNGEAAELLRGCGRRLTWAALAHLSRENNTPELALRTHRAVLGESRRLLVASRYEVSPVLTV